MSYDGPPLTAPQLRAFLSLYDLLITELRDVLPLQQEASFTFTSHRLRAGHPVPDGQVIRGLRLLAQTAATHHRPDLSNKVRNALREVRPDLMFGGDPEEADALYDGAPLSRPQRRAVLSLYDLATRRLRDVLTPGEAAMFVDLRYQLRSDLPASDQLLVHLLKLLGGRAALHGHSDLVVKLYRAYLKMMPNQWSVWYDLGNHLRHISDHDAAIIAYDEALRYNSRDAWSRFNRGRLHYDLGHYDKAVADFIEAARLDCDLVGFSDVITRYIISVRGFTAMITIITDPTLPLEQRQNLVPALRHALDDAKYLDGWYLATPLGPTSDRAQLFITLAIHAELADIRRESPLPADLTFFTRTSKGYEEQLLNKAEMDRKLWYLPPAKPPGTPDRVLHLQRLDKALRIGESADALEVTWAVHYAIGAITLSCLMGSASQWPTSVMRLAIPGEFTSKGFHLDETARAAVVQWVKDSTGSSVTDHAIAHFRAASEILMALSLAATTPDTEEVIYFEDPIRLLTEYVKDPDRFDAPITVKPGSVLRARSLWWFVEPIYREWVLAASYSARCDARLTALCHARQFNTLAATELWSQVPAAQWRTCRTQIMAAYNPDVALADVQTALGPDTMLVDYYTYEISGETLSQLTVTSTGATVTTRDVDLIGGELTAMLTSGQSATLPATGLPLLVERPLVLPTPLPRTLLVVPYGYLRQIPMHALPTVQAAIDSGDIKRVIYLPTVSYVCHRSRTAQRAQRALFVSYDPAGDIDLDRDLTSLRGYIDDITILTGEAAIVATVLAEMPQHDLVHFACHGDLDPQLAAGYLNLADAPLYPWDVLSVPAPDTVVMNACLGISVQRIETSSDGSFGLHDAFLVAGARHVVGGLWEVNEWSAREFATSLYRHLGAGRDVAAAVADAQRDLRSATTDPFLWAPHACFGEWRSA